VPTPNSAVDSQSVLLELDQPKLLIGEGKDETLILAALLDHLMIENIRVEEYGGKQKLPDYLDALRLRPGFAHLVSLGVTRDADEDETAAFASVRNYLDSRGFAAPNVSGHIQASNPSVGIMIFPDGRSAGMLEDLCLAAWRTDPVMTCINDYFDCITRVKGRMPNQISKARVHAWLSAQSPPDLRLGIAAQKRLLDWNNPAFEQLVNFVRAL